MGDSGSMLLGLLLACSTISLTGQIDSSTLTSAASGGGLIPSWLPILLPIAIIFIPLLDLVMAYVRRTLNGNWWFVADKQHLHHRLLRLGHSQVKAVLIMYSWSAVIAFGVIALGLASNRWTVVAVLAVWVFIFTVTVVPLSRQTQAEHVRLDDRAGAK